MKIVKARDLVVGDICKVPGYKRANHFVNIALVGDIVTAKGGSWRGKEMVKLIQEAFTKDPAGRGFERNGMTGKGIDPEQTTWYVRADIDVTVMTLAEVNEVWSK